MFSQKTVRCMRSVLVVLAVLGFYLVTRELFGLNDAAKVVAWITETLRALGLPFIFGAAFIEALLLINWYWPGSGVILLGAALANEVGFGLWPLVAVATAGLWLGYLADYALGRYGWYKLIVKYGGGGMITKAKTRLNDKGHLGTFFWYAHPQTANFVATAAGVLHLKFARFAGVALVATAFWSVLWASLVSLIGLAVVNTLIDYALPIIIVVLAVFIYRSVSKAS